MITHYDYIGFILEMHVWFNMLKSINVINHTTGLKNKDHMITSIEEKKTSLTKSNITS